MRGRILAIAGSDSGGGAGIQADIKTITALGGFAMTAITALTAQDTQRVHAVLPVPAAFLRLQIQVVLADPGADAIKTGMLGDAAAVEVVCEVLEGQRRGIPLVVDPVLRATAGQDLLAPEALEPLKRRLLPLATLLTPNLPEAEQLTGLAIPDEAAMHRAAAALLELGAAAVLLKGGHLEGSDVMDLLAVPAEITEFRAPRIATRHTHGTGCTLASAVATGLAQGMALMDAVARARAYVRAAISAAPGFGIGNGPLNHAISVDPARFG